MALRWRIAEKANVEPYVRKFRLHPAVAQVLVNRGVTLEEAAAWMNPKEEYHCPFLLPDIEKAVERLKAAREKGEHVMVYRDYDVDGTMGGVILVKGLQRYGLNNVGHLAPNRFKHGYGLHKELIDQIASQGYTLIVTVDCGITAVEEIAYARTLGVDVIVTDHHTPGEVLPDAVAVINPKRADSRYPFDGLCGAAVAWKLVQALNDDACIDMIDLVAVATVADVMPLQGENRVIVRRGLRVLNDEDPEVKMNLGIRKLIQTCNFTGKLDSYSIGFGIGPRINAVGRLGDSNAITDLFLTTNEFKADRMAEIVHQINEIRKNMVASLESHADELAEQQWTRDQNVIVLASEKFGEDRNEGIIGIVAAQIMQKYRRPTVLIALGKEKGKASCRSFGPLDMYQALAACSDHLIQFGGHKAAAGFSIELDKVEDFRRAINEYASQYDPSEFDDTTFIDAVVDLEEVDDYMVTQLEALAPFGPGNPPPCFAVQNVTVNYVAHLSNGRHARLGVFDRVSRNAIAFGMGEWIAEQGITEGAKLNIAFRPTFNSYGGKTEIQLEVIDIAVVSLAAVEAAVDAADEANTTPSSPMDSKELAELLFGKPEEEARQEKGKYDGIEHASSFRTKVAGVSYGDRQKVAASLQTGDILYLRREPENPASKFAIGIYTSKNEHVGYINERLARVLAPLLDAGVEYTASVLAVTGGDKEGIHVGLNILVERVSSTEGEKLKDDFDEYFTPKKRVRSGDSVSEAEHVEVLETVRKQLIGSCQYHEKQQEAINAALAGENVLVVMGTGRGKSAIFQTVAAYKNLMFGHKTVILYPLKALLNDQYQAIQRKLAPLGIRTAIASGSLTATQKEAMFARLYDTDILLATPEFILTHKHRFASFMNEVRFVVVDECHHLSDDRFGYRLVSEIIRDKTVMLVTATMNESAMRRIREELRVDRVVVDLTARTNLHVVDARNTPDKTAYIRRVIDEDQKTVIFVNSRQQTVTLARLLRSYLMEIGEQNRVAYYNANLDSDVRRFIEEAFRSGELKFIVATSAFGEGVDIGDIAHVVHYHLPLSLTAFLQQSGRAGRDGRDASIHLLYGKQDQRINRLIIEEQFPSQETLRGILRGLVDMSSAKGESSFRVSNAEIRDAACKHLGENVSTVTVDTALRVFEDLGLIEVDWRSGRLISVKHGDIKDLHEAIIYSESVRDRRAYEDFFSWALSAGSDEIESMIARPLLPTLAETA